MRVWCGLMDGFLVAIVLMLGLGIVIIVVNRRKGREGASGVRE